MLGHQAKLWMREGKAPHTNRHEYIASTSQTFLCKIPYVGILLPYSGKRWQGENIGEFCELMANRQSLLPQIYGIFNIWILLVDYLPKFAPPSNLNS